MERMQVNVNFVEVQGLGARYAQGELTQAQQDAMAERIARVLKERKQVGEERRRQERDKWLRSSQRARDRYLLRMQAPQELTGEDGRSVRWD